MGGNIMGFINWPNKEDKNGETSMGQKVIIEQQQLEYLNYWAGLGRSLQAEKEQLYQQRELIRQDFNNLQIEKEELRKQKEVMQQEKYELQMEKKPYQEQLEREQALRKQAEFKLEVAERELQEELKKQEIKEKELQDLKKQVQVPELPVIQKEDENKKQIQKELAECSKTIRKIQQIIKETYQFEPCHQLCELLVNIRQKVYKEMESIQEDLGCIVETFGIKEYDAVPGNDFDAKYHEQVYSNILDVKGKKIKQVFSSGFEMDGEIIMKAQVSIEEPEIGGAHV